MIDHIRLLFFDPATVPRTPFVSVCGVCTAYSPVLICIVGVRASVFAKAVGETFVTGCAARRVFALCDSGEIARDIGVDIVRGADSG